MIVAYIIKSLQWKNIKNVLKSIKYLLLLKAANQSKASAPNEHSARMKNYKSFS